MKKVSTNELRQMFLDFFKSKGHSIEPSRSLIPVNDNTLLWINSGVATLKKYFDGTENPDNPRIANAQKSIRTNDIENVGFTARHHTFFEMLGNFSIGDYFKEEAIEFAWEFLTSEKWLNFEEEKLYVTIHPEDDESYHIWKDDIGIEENRIIRIEGNFWDIGEGPCGPNTEIFYDRGESYEGDTPREEMYPGGENERYLEIWNLVFSEFNHNSDHTYTPLPKQNIDTGLGLERLSSVIQDVPTNFDTDVFIPIIEEVEKKSNKKYRDNDKDDVAFKVISDHIRTVAFAIGDGALPGNEGRGYVLRRLIRRATRYVKELGINGTFLYTLVDVVNDVMNEFYKEIDENKDFIKKVIEQEEARFLQTLDEGLEIYKNVKEKALKEDKVISGKDAFKLYDTFGFPVEMTTEYAEEDGLTVDLDGFKDEMELQRERARAARKSSDSMNVQSETYQKLTKDSIFTGYNSLKEKSKLLYIVNNEETLDSYDGADYVDVIFDKTPFYAVSGGQVADTGIIYNNHGKMEVTNVYKGPNGQNIHTVKVLEGVIQIDEDYTLEVNRDSRLFIIKNHTATHLLHQALKDVVGSHANQAGSLVEKERLRFDFTHLEGLKEDEIKEIERIVNEKIFESLHVVIEEMPIEDAKRKGAMALFGEKYGDVVRVVDIDEYSVELCGGIHVKNTAEIGLFKIVSESGIGAGVRRIEAVTSKYAVEYYSEKDEIVESVNHLVKAKADNTVSKVENLIEDKKQLEKEVKSLKAELQQDALSDLSDDTFKINDFNLIATEVNVDSVKELRETMDMIKSKNQESIIALISNIDDKVSMIVTVPKSQTKTVKAGDIIKKMAEAVDGKGGGRPDMAQGGGTDVKNMSEALQFVKDYLNSF